MADYKFITCPGIGDFSWLWSKLSTTNDRYHVRYASTGPERLSAFLNLLPKEKILSFAPDTTHRVNFNRTRLEMSLVPPNVNKLISYAQFKQNPDYEWCLEPNTHLEQGKRIEKWLPDLKTDLHYKILGLLNNPEKLNIFIVHLSSRHMQEVWKCYDKTKVIEIVEMVQNKTGWTPVFVGAHYDDFAQEVFEVYNQTHQASSLVGQTDDLLGTLHVMQQSKFFLGCVSSGLTMLANVLYLPVAAWWPRPLLPQSWADEAIPYKWFLWGGYKADMVEIEKMLETL
jgi:hypothetical protein